MEPDKNLLSNNYTQFYKEALLSAAAAAAASQRPSRKPSAPVRSISDSTTGVPMMPVDRNQHVQQPGMERYLDDQFTHWTVHAGMAPPPTLPTTFNADPGYSRRLSHSLTAPNFYPPPPRGGSPQHFADSPARPRRILDREEGAAPVSHAPYFRQPSFKDEDHDEGGWLSRVVAKPKSSGRTRRVCEKTGGANVQYKNVSEKRRRYWLDIYTTLVDSSWGTSLLIFSSSFYSTWVSYALIYYLICLWHGDLSEDLPEGHMPCILEVDGFAAAFLFSLETQHTIGYGTRQTTTECIEAMVVMSTQSVLGCLIQAFMVGLVFAKLSTPNKRAKTVVFSRNCVICERDQQLCLIFRVGDMRKDSFIVGTAISAKLIKRRVTDEGEMFHDVLPLEVSPDSSNEPCIFLIWPITVIHVINKESPFYKMSAQELAADKFEIHVSLEGTIESTSMTFQARTSYLPNEIMWGHRFEPMMIYRRDVNKYQVNFSAFNSTYEVDTPLCSSKDLEEHYKARKKYRQRANAAAARAGRSAMVPPSLPRIAGTPNTSVRGAAPIPVQMQQFVVVGSEEEDDDGTEAEGEEMDEEEEDGATVSASSNKTDENK